MNNLIEQIRDEEIIAKRLAVMELEQELASASAQIPRLESELRGAGTISTKSPQELRKALEEKQNQAFTLRREIDAAKEERDAGVQKWAEQVTKKTPKLIQSERLKAVTILQNITRAIIGEGRYDGLSLIDSYFQYQKIAGEALRLRQELTVASQVLTVTVASQEPIPKGVSKLPPLPQFMKKLAENPYHWVDDGHWVPVKHWDDVLTPDERAQLTEAAAQLKYRLDPTLKAKEEYYARLSIEQDARNRAEPKHWTGGDLFMEVRSRAR